MPTLKAPTPLHGQTSFAGVSRFVPGTSGRIAASQAAKQPKTCDPSYPSLDLVRELPRARGVGESELTRTRERPRQAQLKA